MKFSGRNRHLRQARKRYVQYGRTKKNKMTKKSSDQLIFPLIVGGVSLLNILQNFQEFYLTSVIVSLIGIGATVLFLLDFKKVSILFYVWIIAQLVTYSTSSFTYFANQFPHVSLGLTFKNPNSVFAINFSPLFFFLGYRILKMYDMIGKKVSIKPIKAESNLKAIEGEIVGVINRNKDGKWMKVEYFTNEINEKQYVMIKPKGEERFSRKSSIFAFVNQCGDQTNFIDWGKVKLK